MPNPLVQIVMATYNGEQYLRQQLDTLVAQDYGNFELLVADDVSSDETARIIQDYAERLTIRFEVNPQRLGAKANFAALLQRTTADYVMCCDQDDLWHPDKVRVTLERMREREAASSANTPILAYTDARLIDARGHILESSFWRRSGISPRSADFRNLLVQNLVTGCTMMANRALLALALPFPVRDVVMHDAWFALVACCFGELAPLSMQTIDYRQHGANVVGAITGMSLAARIHRLVKDPVLQSDLRDAAQQAGAFLRVFGDGIPAAKDRSLRGFIEAIQHTGLERRRIMIRHRLFRTGYLNQLQFFVRV